MSTDFEKNKTKQKLVELYIESLKKNEIPWTRGWEKLAAHTNGASKRAYTGTNALLLNMISVIDKYSDTRWFTFNQIKKVKEEHEIEGSIFCKPSTGKGVPITYYGVYSTELKKMLSFDEYKEKVNDKTIDAGMCYFKPFRTYFIFNGDLVNPDILKYFPEAEKTAVMDRSEWSDSELAAMNDFIEKAITEMGVGFEHGGSKAYYNPSEDIVRVPAFEQFKDPDFYYSTVLHELSHATGAATRLNREGITGKHRFGSIEYAKEELNAEIASSFICADLHLQPDEEHINNHAAYIQNWIKVLTDEPEALFVAIKNADAIENYILDAAETGRKKMFIEPEVEDIDR